MSAAKYTIKLTPAPTSEAVRVGLGLALRAPGGVEVAQLVTHKDYGRQVALADGTVGVLARAWTGRGYEYSLEVQQ